MKKFQDFKKIITKEMLDLWNEEICNDLDARLEYLRETDPVKYRSSYDQSFSLMLSLKLLEVYHDWLNQ